MSGRYIVLPTPPSPSAGSSFFFSVTPGSDITDDLLKACADLFSTNYGIWGPSAGAFSKYTKPGQHVKMNSSRLRAQCVSIPDKTVLATCFQIDPAGGNRLIGHAFASVWDYVPNRGDSAAVLVGWVTQLVVDKTFRRRYIATQLLQILKSNDLFAPTKIVGLASSHPAACNTLAKYAAANIHDVDLPFIRDNAAGILASSSISYIKTAPLRGALVQENCDTGAVSSVFTEFYVDHTEPLHVLDKYKAKGRWCLGDLLDGHEFLAIFPVAPLSSIELK